MRQVFLDKGNIAVKEVCQPTLDDYNILVSVHYSLISSSIDLANIEKSKESLFFSNIPQKIKRFIKAASKQEIEKAKTSIKGEQTYSLGHSCSGKIIAAGKKINNLRTGDLVACTSAKFANHADIISVPEILVSKVNKEENLKAASFITLGAIALQSIRRANLQLGEHVCIIGLGLLGQITLQLAQLAGCKAIGIDLLPSRLKLAEELGAVTTYNTNEVNIPQKIAFLTQLQGVDTTIITASSKSDSLIQLAMEITRKKGRVILVGDIGLNIQRFPFYKKEIDLFTSCFYGPEQYHKNYEEKVHDYPYEFVRWTKNRNMQTFVHLIENKKINTDKLISHQISINNNNDDIKKAYELLKNKKSLGIILDYLPQPKNIKKTNIDITEPTTSTTTKEITFKPTQKDYTRLGIIGAGGFAQITLMPIIKQQKYVKINAIVDTDITTSINLSKVYGAKKYFCNDQDLFCEDIVDAVIIASPHHSHYEQAMLAMKNRKAVFLEKPMVTTFEQLEQMSEFLKQNPQIPFCVDYSRAFSPFMKKIKNELKNRYSPLVIHYRMNPGFITKDQWIQSDMNAGRIIGEACHIFDLFCYLTESQPLSVSVESLNSPNAHLFPTDNFCSQISFQDGSICSLIYTSLGNNRLGNERMEIFFDAKSIVMDNYTNLTGYGLNSSFNEYSKTKDKGRTTLINTFFHELKHQTFSHPISFSRLHIVAYLTLTVDQLACQGGGEKTL